LLGVDPIPALTAHFGLASIAMAGLTLFGLALRLQKHDHEQRNAQRVATWGGWVAFIATALQVVVGLWLLATVPPTMQGQMMGNGMVPTLCFLISLGAVLWLLRELAEVTFGEVTRGAMIRSMIAMTTVVFLMTAARQLSRPTAAERTPSVSASTTLLNNR
jgi:cytochrome bd-type quinol oxidase subunit 2